MKFTELFAYRKKLLGTILPELNEETVEKYRHRSRNRSLLLPPLTKWFITPLIRLLPKCISPQVLIIISLVLSALVFGIAHRYLGRYPTVTYPLIALLTTGYILVDAMIRPLARLRSDYSQLTGFLHHYIHGFAFGFFALAAAGLFTSDMMSYGPYLILTVYLAVFFTLQEFSVRKTALHVERVGPTEALLAFAALALICIPRPIYWNLVNPVFAGFAFVDLFLAVFLIGAIATAVMSTYRSKLYLSPATLIYLSSCFLFVMLFMLMKDTMLAMIICTLFNSELIGRMTLARMISVEEISPHFLSLAMLIIGILIEPLIWEYQTSGTLMVGYLVISHIKLVMHSFKLISDRYVVP